MNTTQSNIDEIIYSLVESNSTSNLNFSLEIFKSYCSRHSYVIDFEEILKFDGKDFIRSAYLSCLDRLPEDKILNANISKNSKYILGLIQSAEYKKNISKTIVYAESKTVNIIFQEAQKVKHVYANTSFAIQSVLFMRSILSKYNILRKLYATVTQKPYIPHKP